VQLLVRFHRLDVDVERVGEVRLASNFDGLWRWRPGASAGERVRHGGWLCATPDGDAWAIADRYSLPAIEVHRVGVAEPRRIELQIADPEFYVWTLLPGGDALIGASVLGGPTLAVDVATGRVDPLPGPDAPRAVAGLALTPSPDGRRLAGVRDRRTLVVWDRATGAVTTAALSGEAGDGGRGFSPDGRTFVQSVHTRPAPAGEPHPLEADEVLVWRDGAAPRVVAAEWAVPARDAIVFVARRGGRTEAWAETPDGRRLWTRQVHPDGADDFVSVPHASRDGRRVMWVFSNWEEVVDVATGTLIHEQHMLSSHGSLLVDGDALLVPRARGLLRVDLTHRPWQTLVPGNPGDSGPGALSPSGRWAVRHALGELVRVDVRTGAAEVVPDLCGPWTPEYRVAVDDAGRTLLADDRGLACLFGHDRMDVLSTPGEAMGAAAFAPDGGRFAAGFGATVVEWSGPQLAAREWSVPSNPRALAYAPDGSWLAAQAWTGALTVLDRDGGRRELAVGLPFSKDMVQAIEFAPTGATLAEYRRGAPGVTLHDLATGATRQLAGDASVDVTVEEGAAILHHTPSGEALAVLDGAVLRRWSLARPDAPVRLDVAAGWDFAFLDERTAAILTRDGGLELVDTASGTHAPMRRGVSGRPRPHLARTSDGLALLTWYGEVLRFTDAVPGAGDRLRAWLSGQPDL
jgi:hypothetical protein